MDFGTFEGWAKFTVQVTCLRVSGNTATVAGVVASGQGTDISIGAGFVAVFKDLGVPKGGVSPDLMSESRGGRTSVRPRFKRCARRHSCPIP